MWRWAEVGRALPEAAGQGPAHRPGESTPSRPPPRAGRKKRATPEGAEQGGGLGGLLCPVPAQGVGGPSQIAPEDGRHFATHPQGSGSLTNPCNAKGPADNHGPRPPGLPWKVPTPGPGSALFFPQRQVTGPRKSRVFSLRPRPRPLSVDRRGHLGGRGPWDRNSNADAQTLSSLPESEAAGRSRAGPHGPT